MDKRLKWIAYGAIILFSVVFTVLIGLFVVKPAYDKKEIERILRIKQAAEYAEKGDSIMHVVDVIRDSITRKAIQDSVQHAKEKQKIKSKYINEIKKYESRLSGIDTLTDVQLNGEFSIRKMLSDSASKLW